MTGGLHSPVGFLLMLRIFSPQIGVTQQILLPARARLSEHLFALHRYRHSKRCVRQLLEGNACLLKGAKDLLQFLEKLRSGLDFDVQPATKSPPAK